MGKKGHKKHNNKPKKHGRKQEDSDLEGIEVIEEHFDDDLVDGDSVDINAIDGEVYEGSMDDGEGLGEMDEYDSQMDGMDEDGDEELNSEDFTDPEELSGEEENGL
jgi:hypothetical protein